VCLKIYISGVLHFPFVNVNVALMICSVRLFFILIGGEKDIGFDCGQINECLADFLESFYVFTGSLMQLCFSSCSLCFSSLTPSSSFFSLLFQHFPASVFCVSSWVVRRHWLCFYIRVLFIGLMFIVFRHCFHLIPFLCLMMSITKKEEKNMFRGDLVVFLFLVGFQNYPMQNKWQ